MGVKECKYEIPDEIWLQIIDEDGETATYEDEVTWCEDKINEFDIRYIRVPDPRLQEAVNEMLSEDGDSLIHEEDVEILRKHIPELKEES